jgi:hypothetical protein
VPRARHSAQTWFIHVTLGGERAVKSGRCAGTQAYFRAAWRASC